MDVVQADALRLMIKKMIFSSWNSRSTLFGGPFLKLSCYPDVDIEDKKPRLEVDPRDCPRGTTCCLKNDLTGRPSDLLAVRRSIAGNPGVETSRRANILRQLEKHPNNSMTPSECRSLGDAYFVLFCPPGAVIATTNVKDIKPMAAALGLAIDTP